MSEPLLRGKRSVKEQAAGPGASTATGQLQLLFLSFVLRFTQHQANVLP